MLRYLFLMVVAMNIFGCSSSKDFKKTVQSVDMNRFMVRWYVIGGRLTSFEDGAHNAIESYSWNEKEQRVDIDFTMRIDSFDGKLKSIPQKGWIQNSKTNAHWKISPFWPLKLNYLIIDLADDYSWTVIGVPSQKWVWIMAKDWDMKAETFEMIVSRIENMGYSIKDIIRVPQKW